MPKLRAGGGETTTPGNIHDPDVVGVPSWQTCWETSLMICKSLSDNNSGKVTTPKSANWGGDLADCRHPDRESHRGW